MSKFGIDAGHGDVNRSLGGDGGAVGYLVEQDCALDIANKVIEKLESLGHTAWNTRPTKASSVTDSLQRRCDASSGTDYLISIHLNAGKGKGTEVFAMSEAGKTLANKVLNELVGLGFMNRGVKDGSGLYVIKHSSPVAILIEVCFVDTQSDADLYNQLGSDKIANAIVKAITGQSVAPKIDAPFVVCYNNEVDKRSALYLAEYLGCETIDNSTTPFDYEKYYPICVGGGNFTSYMKLNLKGADRYKTMLEVAKYIEGRR